MTMLLRAELLLPWNVQRPFPPRVTPFHARFILQAKNSEAAMGRTLGNSCLWLALVEEVLNTWVQSTIFADFFPSLILDLISDLTP